MGGLIGTATIGNNGLMSANDYKYSNHYIPYLGGNLGSERTLLFTFPVNSSVMLMLTMTRGDGQVGVIILSICRGENGIYSASRMAFANQSAGFKSKGFIYYNGDNIYVKFGHYDGGSYHILAVGGYPTFNGIAKNPLMDNFTNIDVADMTLNPTS